MQETIVFQGLFFLVLNCSYTLCQGLNNYQIDTVSFLGHRYTSDQCCDIKHKKSYPMQYSVTNTHLSNAVVSKTNKSSNGRTCLSSAMLCHTDMSVQCSAMSHRHLSSKVFLHRHVCPVWYFHTDMSVQCSAMSHRHLSSVVFSHRHVCPVLYFHTDMSVQCSAMPHRHPCPI